jgi:ABC-type transport system involved in multi-copper enzyme maturation permease subunit
MSTIAAVPVRVPRATVKPIPLNRITAVELRKMFDTRSGFWLIASIAITALLATGAVVLFAPNDELTYSSFVSAIGFPVAILLPLIAILSVTSEWSQRTGLTTFTLVPHRHRIITAKIICSVIVGVVSILLAFAIGALGNLLNGAVTGTDLVWDVTLTDASYFVLGNVLGLLIGFMLGTLIRASTGAIAAYFIYSFVMPGIFIILATNQEWFKDWQPWLDVTFAQAPLLAFDGALTGEQWANIAVTGLFWLVIPLAVGLRLVTRAEVK